MKTRRTLAFILLALLLAGAAPAIAGAHPSSVSAAPAFKEVPTQACVCQATVQGGSATPAVFRPANPLAPPAVYDEQLGATFTQSFIALAYNVTAVEQIDSTSGEGPAYLLNGLSNEGLWYQVGLSWNWNPGTKPGTGFAMSYETFNGQGASVFPADGSGGLLDFSGTVNQGDSVLLNLYFSSGDVMMVAHDWNTGASASENYTADGATSFQGDTQANSNTNGFFTGLMTEWYHTQPYLSNEKEVIYLEGGLGITSAWMWMDEYNPNGRGQTVFSNATLAPISFTSDPTKLQEFSSHGATEHMDAHEFITGAMNATALVPLTLSYAVLGGGGGYSAPVLSYVSGGIPANSTVSTTPTQYNLDEGSAWSVTTTLGGSTTDERWATGQQTAGNATVAQTIALSYYHQYAATVSFMIRGAETTGPDFTYTTFGAVHSAITALPAIGVWADAGTQYGMSGTLTGSNAQERWGTTDSLNGTAAGPFSLAPTYYQQFLVSAKYSTIGGGDPASAGEIYLSAPSFGSEGTTVLTPNAQSLWLDAGSAYGVTQNVSSTEPFSDGGGAGFYAEAERWITNSTGGTVTEGLGINPQYQNQYLVALQPSSAAAGTVSVSGGWYDAGTKLQVTATANSGWKLATWTSATPLASPTLSANGSISLEVNSPVNDTAVFYPGLTISTAANMVISYSYASGAASGTISEGSTVVYAPPGGIRLSASTSSFLNSFAGWSGASSSSSPSISLMVIGPTSISARSTYNYLDIAIILGAVILLIAVAAALASRRTGKQ